MYFISDKCYIVKTENDIVITTPMTNKNLFLNEIASDIFCLIEMRHSKEDIVNHLFNQYSQSKDIISESVDKIITLLLNEGVLSE